MQNVRDRIGPDKYMIINTGAGFRGLADITVPNGLIWEYSGPDHDFDWKRRNMDHNIKRTAQPHISLFLYQASWGHPDNPNPEWEFFPYMRYGLTQTMMWGFYFQYEPLLLIDGGGRYEHLHNKYYDEYDLDVGCPTSEMQRIGQSEIWARFFDQGAAILNANGHDVTVTDEQLKELDGYDGPYYRFRGGQDSDFNNGELFNFVDLKGYSFKENKLDYKSGDGIVLVKIPQTVVSEIIIDDHNSGTSPASRKAEFSGNWQHSCEGGSHYAVAHCAMNLKDKLYLTAYTTEDSGNAVFRPTISIAGDYEVFEWHGNIKDKQEASNVEYELKHANGVETGLIDQSAIQGKWNSLGIFSFEKGTTGFVKLKASGANGAVVADAVKFVYVDDEGSGFVAADLNEDGVVDILDLVLLVRAFGTSEYDLTSDGTVDVQDLLIIIQKL